MALSQKPLAARCFGDQSGEPAWKQKPSWYQISTQDRMIAPELEHDMAERIKPQKTLKLDVGHASMFAVTDVSNFILEAAQSVLSR